MKKWKEVMNKKPEPIKATWKEQLRRLHRSEVRGSRGHWSVLLACLWLRLSARLLDQRSIGATRRIKGPKQIRELERNSKAGRFKG